MLSFREFLTERALSVKPTEYNTDSELIANLSYYATRNHLDKVKELIDDKNVDPNAKNSWGGTALGNASANSHLEIVKFLLSRGADASLLTYKDIKQIDDVNIFKLIQHGVIPDEVFSAVWSHISNGVYDVKSEMFKLQTKLFNKTQLSELLYVSARTGNEQYVKPLIKLGADINALDPQIGKTPLMSAVENDKRDMVKLLLKLGADKEIVGAMGKKAIDYANNDAMRALLLDK